MNDWKSYLRSRSIWANLIGLSALVLNFFGLQGLAGEDQVQLVDAILKIVEAGGFIAGAIFRAIASKRLGSAPLQV